MVHIHMYEIISQTFQKIDFAQKTESVLFLSFLLFSKFLKQNVMYFGDKHVET